MKKIHGTVHNFPFSRVAGRKTRESLNVCRLNRRVIVSAFKMHSPQLKTAYHIDLVHKS